MKKFVVDVQGFKGPLNEFIFKEMAIARLHDDSTPRILVFKKPTWLHQSPQSATSNRHLELNFHGLSLDKGDIPYDELSKTLHEILDNSDIYVKGREKAEWLRVYFPEERVHDIADLGCPSLNSLPPKLISCDLHGAFNPKRYRKHFEPVCAVKNMFALRDWMISHGHVERDSANLYYMYN